VQPESTVGVRGHRVKLRNLYDPASDGHAIWRRGHDANSSELAVHLAGYDGYYIRDYLRRASGHPFGVAILLGPRAVPVKKVGSWRGNGFTKPSPIEAPVKNPLHYQRFPYMGKS